jgi:protein phosphatase
VVCRDEDAAVRRFGVSGASGALYTRTGRRFFDSQATEAEMLKRVVAAANGAGLWDKLESDWFVLDCELLPWSAKATPLIRNQYASVGAAAQAGLGAAVEVLRAASARFPELDEVLARTEERLLASSRFREAYRHYAWAVDDLEG